jgi:outer membrane immunogenic protein
MQIIVRLIRYCEARALRFPDTTSPVIVSCVSGAQRAVAIAVVGLGCLEVALAADLPSMNSMPVYAPPPAPIFTWTGFYVGGNVGYGIDHVSYPYDLFNGNSFIQNRDGLTESGPVLGGQVGYNYQLKGLPLVGDHLVVGVEAFGEWSGVDGASTSTTAGRVATFGTRIESYGGLVGRIGYAFDRLLVYLEGGIPFGVTKSYYSVGSYSGSRTVARFQIGKQNIVGAGLEYTFAENWSLRLDYLYSYVAAKWVEFDPEPGVSFQYLSRTSFHSARIGLDYHFDLFGLPTPVSAKY